MNGDWLRAQEKFYRTALDQHVLPFWYAHGYDTEHGGFFAQVYADGQKQTQKSGWNQGRGLWIFSRYFRCHGRQPRYLKAATHSRDFFLRRGFDALGDGLSLLDAQGRQLASPTSIYTDIYWIHGLAEHALASGDETSLTMARKSVQRVHQRIIDPLFQHSLSVYTRPHQVLAVWFLLLDALIDLLHLEPDDDLEQLAALCVDRLLNLHLDQASGLFVEVLAPNGTRFPDAQGRETMPGHAAQACRILAREAERRSDNHLHTQSATFARKPLSRGLGPRIRRHFLPREPHRPTAHRQRQERLATD